MKRQHAIILLADVVMLEKVDIKLDSTFDE